MNYRFTLEPYKGVSTRHTCPNCHRKSCFAKYINTEKQINFPDYVGRCCNHEQKCGYNYTPKMYFDENPMAKGNHTEKENETIKQFLCTIQKYSLEEYFFKFGEIDKTLKKLKRKAGYRFEDASCVKALRHATIPMMFIHGGADTFVNPKYLDRVLPM